MASLTSVAFKKRFVTALNENESLNAICQEIVSEMQCGEVKLHTVVEGLGPFLTNKKADIREKGVSALSTILTSLPKDFLNETELRFITSFYCDRFKDFQIIIPAVLRGVLAIVQMDHLPKQSPELLFRALSDNVQCQTQVLSDRQIIYLILIRLLQNRIEDLKTIGPDFVYGMISFMDGERDPRNLILLFSILPYFIKNFSLGHLTEDMFEVIACYFPVDFNTPASEEIGITRNDLAEKLAPCLCAIPEFVDYCIPLVIDKLLSSLKTAKLDSLTLLCKGVPVFGVKGLKEHLDYLWDALKKEIIPGGDSEIKNASLKALMTIIEVISSDITISEGFIDRIIADTKSSLFDVQLSLFKTVVKLLESIAMVNKESCTQVLKAVVPLCLGQYSTKTAMIDKVILIETLNVFIKVASDHGINIKDIPELSWTDIPQLYLTELSQQNSELQIRLLSGLTIQKVHLNKVHRTMLYDEIYKLHEKCSSELRCQCNLSLLHLAVPYPQEILELIKEKFQLNSELENAETQIRKVELFAVVAKTYRLGIEVLPLIVSQTSAMNYDISFTAITCLHKLVATKDIDYDVQHYLHRDCNIIEKLSALNLKHEDHRLNLSLNICRLIVRSLTVEEQQEIVNKYAVSLSNEIPGTVIMNGDAAMIMNIFIPLRQNVLLPSKPNLLQNLCALALNSKCINIRSIACRFNSVFLNKIKDNDDFQQTFLYFSTKIIENLNSNLDTEQKKAAASLQIWLTKAVITRGSDDVETVLNELTNGLKHDDVGYHLAQEYKILTKRHEDGIVEENYCNVKIFYKQRIFEHFIKKDKEFQNVARQNYLTALVQLLEEVPVELLFMHLTKLVPLLTESLSLDNEQLIFSTLITVKPLLESKHAIFSDKAQCFIPKFIELSTYKTMRVRIEALECLANYCNYPTVLINIYKQDVIKKLANAIDDKKRLVRKAAVKARAAWFLVGAPGGITEQ